MAEPELTVVIPTKNRPDMLRRAIASVLAEADDVEVVVVDDGSSPDAARLVREICVGERVRLLRNDASRGAPSARNQGLDVGRGRWWATLDDDDRWLPGKWRAQRAVFEAEGFPEDLVVVAGARFVFGSGPDKVVVPDVRGPERIEGLEALLRRVRTSAFLNTYVAPRELMRSIGGYDGRLVWGEHTDVLIRLGQAARFAGVASVGTLVNREHEDSASRVGRDWIRKVDGIRLLLDKHRDRFDREPELRDSYLHLLGLAQLRAGDRWGATRTFREVVRSAPGAARRARGLAQLLTSAIGGPRLWRFVSRARGIQVDAIR